MESNYESIVRRNLSTFFSQLSPGAEARLGAERDGEGFVFRAFAGECRLEPEGIFLSGEKVVGPKGLLISLYALHAIPDPIQLQPFKAFKEMPNSMPYHAAFSANSEKVLVPHVPGIREKAEIIMELFGAEKNPPESSGDFSFVLYPLPKIALYYIFYLPDEEFPSSATCLFSANALSFMPLDGLADVAEYTSGRIIEITNG